ncbi:MAG TPA: AAA family ATPase [Acidimicrobiales bacterium]|nr:AAA family ATPase [Acidimicrobiales bacterium]
MHALIGRDDELQLLERFVVGSGGEALLIEGDPGIGKTSLWGLGVELCRRKGLRVLTARPCVEDAHFAYSALADLLGTVEPARYAALPDPRREALETALMLRRATGGVGARALAIGLLDVLRSLAEEGALIVALDDLAWVDAPSAEALTFAIRRLEDDENVRFLLASRSGESPPLCRAFRPSALEHMSVGPLDVVATRRLLHDRLGLGLPRRVLQRVAAASGGNPLFALELGRSLAAAGPQALGAALPSPATLEAIVSERVGALSEPVRRLLLAAALGPGVPASRLPGRESLAEALDAEVVVLDADRLRAQHPLLAAIVVSNSRPGERRAVHLELADAATDEEQCCYHLARATDLPDAAIADRVAGAAELADARGATSTAAELAEHAWRLTPAGSPRYAERCLAAASRLCDAGELERGRAVLAPQLAALPAPGLLVQGRLLASKLGVPNPPGVAVPGWRYWLDQALEAAEGHAELRATVVAQRSSDLLFVEAGPVGELEADLRDVEQAARRYGPQGVEELEFALSWAAAMRGRAVDRPAAGPSAVTTAALHSSPERTEAVRLIWRGQVHEARAALARLLAVADERGEAESYFVIRLHLCELELRAGRLDAVGGWLDEWSEEGDSPLAAQAGLARMRAMLAASRGEPEPATRHAREAIEWSGQSGDRWQWLEAHRALGIANLAAGDCSGAARALRLVAEHAARAGIDEPGVFPVGPDLVEALCGIQAFDEGRAALAALSRAAYDLDHPWGRASEARCRALLRPGAPEAVALLEQATESYDELGLHFDRARTLLALGNVLSSRRRPESARATLAKAAEAFDELGSPGWAERARREGSGLRNRRPGRRPLTPAEQRVAELVAIGYRNREVAAELFINEKTVESHLSRIYEKVGVRSRTELAHRFGESRSDKASG